MLKTISILVILAAGIFAFSYFYKPSRLELTSNMIILKAGMEDYNYPYSVIKKDTKEFSNVHIEQYSLQNETEKFIFEKAEVDGLYEFNNNSKEVISKLFNAKNMNSLFEKNGLEALQLTLADDKRINLFALISDSNQLNLLYGVSDTLFSKTIEKLAKKKAEPINGNFATKPLTLWSSEINDMNGVIGSIDH